MRNTEYNSTRTAYVLNVILFYVNYKFNYHLILSWEDTKQIQHETREIKLAFFWYDVIYII